MKSKYSTIAVVGITCIVSITLILGFYQKYQDQSTTPLKHFGGC